MWQSNVIENFQEKFRICFAIVLYISLLCNHLKTPMVGLIAEKDILFCAHRMQAKYFFFNYTIWNTMFNNNLCER